MERRVKLGWVVVMRCEREDLPEPVLDQRRVRLARRMMLAMVLLDGDHEIGTYLICHTS